jgi:hypothetical protein
LERSLFPFFADEYFVLAYLTGGGAESLRALGKCYSLSGASVLAHGTFRLSVEQEPDDPDLVFCAGVESLNVFLRSEGLELLARAVRLEPSLRNSLHDLPLRPEELDALLAS